MRRIDHALLSPSLGVQKSVTSFHFGTPGSGLKIYIQASLHAEELPGMLVAHHLWQTLHDADAKQNLKGEVVLVPVANPVGLGQRLDHKPMGRFELDTSENFNRHYPDLAKAVLPQVRSRIGQDGIKNVRIVREAIGGFLHDWRPDTELQSLRRTLLTLAYDADDVLDLHCDCESVMHLYTEEPGWPHFADLSAYTRCQAALLARNSGSGPFDECLSGVWWKLAEALQREGVSVPLPQGCQAVTLELRGEADVSHELAASDAAALADYLRLRGVLQDRPAAPVPPSLCVATPLAGSETLHAQGAGLIVYAVEPGTSVVRGDLVAEIINPVDRHTECIVATVDGIFYARVRDRYVVAGGEIGKVAGTIAFRTGELLGA